ncbi:MAG: hypothetical protein ACRCYY_10490, partial [Trueperaceae bacterium]
MAIAETTFNVNKKQDAGLEPGLLRAFRLFNLTPDLSVLGLFLAPLFPNVATRIPAEVMPGGVTRGFVLYAVVSSLIQLLYFLWPHLPKRLGQLYFPIGIVLGTAIPLGRILFILYANPEWFYRQLPSGLLQTYFLIPLIF